MPSVPISVWISYDGSSHAFTAHWASIQVNVVDIRRNKALRIVGQTLLVLLALATMIGGWIVIGTG
jgi:hypothetical protein